MLCSTGIVLTSLHKNYNPKMTEYTQQSFGTGLPILSTNQKRGAVIVGGVLASIVGGILINVLIHSLRQRNLKCSTDSDCKPLAMPLFWSRKTYTCSSGKCLEQGATGTKK